MVKITKILENLDSESEQLDFVLSQNNMFNQEIIEKIESTINKVDYYELFEKVLKDVIEELNHINIRLRKELENLPEPYASNNLKDLETLYTVASERIIHQNYLDGNSQMDLSIAEIPDEDVELF
jgi:flagellar biosynthesis chaperone FliJ